MIGLENNVIALDQIMPTIHFLLAKPYFSYIIVTYPEVLNHLDWSQIRKFIDDVLKTETINPQILCQLWH